MPHSTKQPAAPSLLAGSTRGKSTQYARTHGVGDRRCAPFSRQKAPHAPHAYVTGNVSPATFCGYGAPSSPALLFRTLGWLSNPQRKWLPVQLIGRMRPLSSSTKTTRSTRPASAASRIQSFGSA